MVVAKEKAEWLRGNTRCTWMLKEHHQTLLFGLLVTTYETFAELEAQFAQLRLQQVVQEHVVGTITVDHQSLALQLPTFAANVDAKAHAMFCN